jgi:hypothetical protein
MTTPELLLGVRSSVSGRRPIASRRGCMKRHCAFSLTAPMPKRTQVDVRVRAPRKVKTTTPVAESAPPLTWIKPQLTRLVDEAPTGTDWLHEIKYDGYRMHARIEGDKIQLLTRTGLDWSHRYKRTIKALRSLLTTPRPLRPRQRFAQKQRQGFAATAGALRRDAARVQPCPRLAQRWSVANQLFVCSTGE